MNVSTCRSQWLNHPCNLSWKVLLSDSKRKRSRAVKSKRMSLFFQFHPLDRQPWKTACRLLQCISKRAINQSPAAKGGWTHLDSPSWFSNSSQLLFSLHSFLIACHRFRARHWTFQLVLPQLTGWHPQKPLDWIHAREEALLLQDAPSIIRGDALLRTLMKEFRRMAGLSVSTVWGGSSLSLMLGIIPSARRSF